MLVKKARWPPSAWQLRSASAAVVEVVFMTKVALAVPLGSQ
jgi:hypothetical protein